MATILLKNTTQRPIRPIKNFVFPEGVRVLVNLTIDYDTSVFRTYLGEPPLWRSQGEFGGRVGLYRLLDVLDNFHVPATIFLPGQTAQRIQSPAAFLRTLLTGYEAARTGTRYMNIVLHPNLSGRSSRIMPIERFLQRASDDGDVRFVTSAWLARYILDNFPAEQQE